MAKRRGKKKCAATSTCKAKGGKKPKPPKPPKPAGVKKVRKRRSGRRRKSKPKATAGLGQMGGQIRLAGSPSQKRLFIIPRHRLMV
jgi:hypothetical protein